MRYYYGGVLLTLALTLTACDTEPGLDPCREPLQVLHPIEDAVFIMGDEAHTLDLGAEPAYFNATGGKNVNYSVESADGGIAGVQSIGERGRILRFVPGQVGETEILVRASDECGGEVEQRFAVQVVRDCEGEISLEHADPSFAFYAGEDTLLGLGGDVLAFENAGERPLSYEATSGNASVEIEVLELGGAQYLRFSSSEIGEARVTVTASDACGKQAEAELVVQVLDPCPPPPEAGKVDYLPLTVGDAWVFDYTSSFGSADGPSGDAEGTLTWTIESAEECRRGRQPYTVRSTLEDSTFFESNSYPPQGSTRTELVTVTVLGDSVLLPFMPEPVLRFGPASGPDTLTYTSSTITVFYEYQITLKLVKGRGLVYRSRYDGDKTSTSREQFIRRDGN